MSAYRRDGPRLPREAGFSLLELAVVVLLVAVFAAVGITHLGRAREPTLDARITSLAGTLQSAVSDFQANWRLQGRGLIDVPGWGDGSLDANAAGFPVGGRRDVAAVGSDQDCVDIWRGLLNGGPGVATAGVDTPHSRFADRIQSLLGTGVEFAAGQDDTIGDATVTLPATPAAEICQFVWLHERSTQPGTSKRTIFYDSRTGTVFTDLERVF